MAFALSLLLPAAPSGGLLLLLLVLTGYGVLEAPNRLAKSRPYLGKTGSPKEKKDYDQDDDEFGWPRLEWHLPFPSSFRLLRVVAFFSFFSSSPVMAFLKPLIAWPNPDPIWGRREAPKRRKTMTKMMMSSVGPGLNGICPFPPPSGCSEWWPSSPSSRPHRLWRS